MERRSLLKTAAAALSAAFVSKVACASELVSDPPEEAIRIRLVGGPRDGVEAMTRSGTTAYSVPEWTSRGFARHRYMRQSLLGADVKDASGAVLFHHAAGYLLS